MQDDKSTPPKRSLFSRIAEHLPFSNNLFGTIAGLLTIAAVVVGGAYGVTVNDDRNELQGAVDSLERQKEDLETTNAELTEENESLRERLEQQAEEGERATTTTEAETSNQWTLEFGDGNYIDLDTRRASLEGGPEYELRLDFGRFFTGARYNTWADVRVAFINDADVSLDGCQASTRIQGEVVHLSELEQDETLCVTTNQGVWAAMKIIAAESSSSGLGAGDITFDVTMFGP